MKLQMQEIDIVICIQPRIFSSVHFEGHGEIFPASSRKYFDETTKLRNNLHGQQFELSIPRIASCQAHHSYSPTLYTHTHTHSFYLPLSTLEIKVWVLADSHNGYFPTLQVYTGREGSGESQLGQRVVKDLTRLLKGKNHHVFFDNFFTSE